MALESRINGRVLSRWIGAAALAAASALTIHLATGRAAADDGKDGARLCTQSSRDMQRSCRFGALSDYWLATAMCDNLRKVAERKACRRQAWKDMKEALSSCSEQLAARQEVCQGLGEGPYDPKIDAANFVSTIDNPYFPLEPGTTFIYEGDSAAGHEHEEFAVTHKTKKILGVACVEVRDTSSVNGDPEEDTQDWFAQDKDGNVWYFGEATRQLAGGEVIGVEGSWEGGVDGAKPGIIMEAHPQPGDLYRQEFSLDTAEDMAEVADLKASVTVPFGSFDHCLAIKEFTPLEPGASLEEKFYATGIGLLLTVVDDTGDRLELVEIQKE